MLDRFLSDPTAYGVSLALAESEEQLEAALLPWCSVVGSAFTSPSRSRSTGSIAPGKLVKQVSKQIFAFDRWKSLDVLDTDSSGPVAKVFRRLSRGSTPSRPMSGDNSSTGSLISDSVHSSDNHTSSPSSESNPVESPVLAFRYFNPEELPWDTSHQPDLYPHDSRRYVSSLEVNGSREPSRVCSFRDLAILPTQRVVRYVLLFRGTDSLSARVPIVVVLSAVHRPSC